MDGSQRIAELERTIHRAWLLVGGCNDPNTMLALLPAGGLECERFAEIVRDELAKAIGKPAGFRGMRTLSNDPAPHDELDAIAERIMSECSDCYGAI